MLNAPKTRVMLSILIAIAAFSTVVALVPLNHWWIRGFDFPRVPIASVLGAALLGFALVARRQWRDLLVASTGVLCLGYQCYRIFPYTPLASHDVRPAEGCAGSLRLVTANVLMTNRDAESFLAIVRESDPDMLFVVETDTWWDEALAPLERDYPHQIAEPLDNTYGLHLYSRFPLAEEAVRYVIEDDIPSIRTRVTLANGQDIVLFGVHPRPPRPGSDTDQRDGELITVAREVVGLSVPAVVAGDLNDVAWSATTRLLREVGGLHDPRIGRGLYASYHADYAVFRWPLDHVFVTESFTLREVSVLAAFGSDHFPLLTHLCTNGAQDTPEPVDAEEAEDADDAIEEAHEAEAVDGSKNG